ncbi:O-antigen ligase family protein [Diaminobutyricimonas sp. TR449]|uniref:O-antigen ligase family protein n=1 Tax=Diaminobutyricimonas sp. TR449 TaxID=2708076 RepID=UPI00142392AC|nr:O-antigen ligase family protein [Diaminobutyricimonas sp. TR449]
MTKARDIRVGVVAFLFFVAVGGPAIRNALGWWGWGVAVAAALTVSLVWVIRERRQIHWNFVPFALVLWMLLAALSISWSAYPLSSLLGVGALFGGVLLALPLGTLTTRAQLRDGFALMARWVLGLSLVFELIVSWFVRHPVAPVWLGIGWEESLKQQQWSRNVLFVDGKIQGLLGNSTATATLAAVALIVFAIQFVDDRNRRAWHVGWIVVAAGIILLTRSAGVLIALVAVAAVLVLMLAVRRYTSRRARITIASIAAAAVLGAVIAVTFFDAQLLALLGKDSTLTNRTGIWETVIGVADDRPWFGWGWVSYWTPWVEPFEGLVTINGVTQTHAHNAWLDIWLQLGIVGLVVFALLVLRTLIRAWTAATDRPRLGLTQEGAYDATSVLPLLVVVLLLVQSASESHLLVEGWWVMFTALAIRLKSDAIKDPGRL